MLFISTGLAVSNECQLCREASFAFTMSWATSQKATGKPGDRTEPEELLPELLDIGPGDRESNVQRHCTRSAKQSSRSSKSTPFSQCSGGSMYN
jgi:hypothetical protein